MIKYLSESQADVAFKFIEIFDAHYFPKDVSSLIYVFKLDDDGYKIRIKRNNLPAGLDELILSTMDDVLSFIALYPLDSSLEQS
jgi:hypothetical protein